MATIKHIKTPDGVTHDIDGGGGSPTYTPVTGKPTSNQTPAFGGTATISQISQASSGQISATDRTIKIPDTEATTSSAGLMSAADKTKLNGIASGAEVNVQANWNQSDSSADDYIQNKPTIPTVNNATLTIQKNGTTIDTFTANSSTNKTVNVTVPTATSDLTNNSNFVSDASYVHTDNNFTTTLKNKLDGIESGAEVNVQANWTQSNSSSDDYIKNKPSLATVATTGDYDDLSNKPTIPTVSVTQKTSTGTNIADITVSGTTTQLYAPSGGGGGGLSFDDIYPVGSIYMSVSSTNPGTLFGGTWVQIEDTFLLSAGSTYTAGNTGGASTVTLQEAELPTVTSHFDIRAWGSSGNTITVGTHYSSGNGAKMNYIATGSSSVTSQRVTHSFGSGNAHDNMPPYLVVYVWKRTA